MLSNIIFKKYDKLLFIKWIFKIIVEGKDENGKNATKSFVLPPSSYFVNLGMPFRVD